MNILLEYQPLIGMVVGIISCYTFMYKPTMKLIEQNERRIETIENKIINNSVS